jgi:ribosomal-protein-alanine N-acetyltransferase
MSPPSVIVTSRMQLVRSSPAHLQALMAGDEQFERQFGQRVIGGFFDFPKALEFSLRQMAEGGDQADWWAPFLILHTADRAVIGMGGYKGPPDAAGVVEIGYGIAPDYRGRGLATEAAQALTAEAWRMPDITVVRAHTLPVLNASARVLEKSGFHRAGEGEDEDEGVVWRWEHSV